MSTISLAELHAEARRRIDEHSLGDLDGVEKVLVVRLAAEADPGRFGHLLGVMDPDRLEKDRWGDIVDPIEIAYVRLCGLLGASAAKSRGRPLAAKTLEITAGRVNGRTRPKGYAPWRPQKATQVLLASVGEVFDEYEDHLPLTVRQIFYRLVASYGFEKTELAYNRLAEHLVRARRSRMIPFGCIRDDGVVTYSSRWHDGIEEFWNDTGRRIRSYSRDRQAGQPCRIELWCEAAGMAPQLARVADEYSVPVFSSGGFASLTAVRNIADRALGRMVPTTLLHVGDFDPSGESIFSSIAADAAAFVEADRVVRTLEVRALRVALTEQQVAFYSLPTVPPKASDSRSGRWRGHTCQLEALAPDVLAGIVEGALERLMDMDKLEVQVARESHDRIELWRALPPGAGSSDE